LSGIRFRKEFGNVDKLSIEFGCRIITNFEFPFKFGRIAVVKIDKKFFFIFSSFSCVVDEKICEILIINFNYFHEVFRPKIK